MNILVLTKSGEYCEEAQQSIPFNSRRIESSVFKDECDKPRFVYCKYDDEQELYEFIDQNNPQVIFIDADDIYDLKIAEKTLKHYGQSCPDLVGFSKHIVNGQNLKDISRDYDYVHFKVSTQDEAPNENRVQDPINAPANAPTNAQDEIMENSYIQGKAKMGVGAGVSSQQDEQFFNYLRRKVIRYKSGRGSQGLITRNGDDFLFNNKTMIKLTLNQRRFLTVLFEEGGSATWKIFCYEFEKNLKVGAITSKKDVESMTKKEKKENRCSEIHDAEQKDSMKLNVFLTQLLNRLNSSLEGQARENGFKFEGKQKLISSSGTGKDAKWKYEDKIKLSKIDISND